MITLLNYTGLENDMKKILLVMALLSLSGCTTFSFYKSPLQAETVTLFSMRTPAPLRFEIKEDNEGWNAQIKQALLASGVVVEDNASSRTLSISTNFTRESKLPVILSLLSLGVIPSTDTINVTADLVLSNADGSQQKYAYVTQYDIMEGWFTPLMGRDWDDNTRELGAIVGSHFLNDVNRSNAL